MKQARPKAAVRARAASSSGSDGGGGGELTLLRHVEADVAAWLPEPSGEETSAAAAAAVFADPAADLASETPGATLRAPQLATIAAYAPLHEAAVPHAPLLALEEALSHEAHHANSMRWDTAADGAADGDGDGDGDGDDMGAERRRVPRAPLARQVRRLLRQQLVTPRRERISAAALDAELA